MSLAICLESVCKHYEHFELRDVSLQLPEGEIMGLVGVNGAGKTTLLRILMGLSHADEGEVRVLGWPMPAAQAQVKRDTGYATEDMRLYAGQTLAWHMALIRSIYPEWDSGYATTLLRRFDLKAEQKVKGFSHGQRVKALLMLCLARRPKLLLLDEPTTGLDPVARIEVLEALFDVLRDSGRSVLFSSHNTRDVEQLSDSIAFLHRGRLLSHADKEAFLDGWRRIRCQGVWPESLDACAEFASRRQNGSLIEIKAKDYSEGLLERLKAGGLQIVGVDAMDLEDIFVTTVRQGDAA